MVADPVDDPELLDGGDQPLTPGNIPAERLFAEHGKFYLEKGSLVAKAETMFYGNQLILKSMKPSSSRFHAPAPVSNDASQNARRFNGSTLTGVCAVFAVAVSLSQVHTAGAAPKATPTPAPAPTATATPTATPTPAPAPTATPATEVTPNYSGTQQTQYISTARDAFVVLRNEKSQPFLDAHKAMDAAGGLSARGLKTKADIAARRDLIAKTAVANEDYLAFVKTQEETYRAELAKTPLTPTDISGLVIEFAAHANTPTVVKIREDERDVLKIGDNLMAILDKKFGAWTANDAGRITFKKPADASAYSKAIANQGAKVAEIDKLRAQISATPSPSPSASPASAPAGSPAAAPTTSAKP